jgi:hypothetical protein
MQESKCCPFKFFMTLFHDNGDVGEKFGGVRLKPFAESTCAGANQIARLHGGRQSGQGTSPAENTTHEHRAVLRRSLSGDATWDRRGPASRYASARALAPSQPRRPTRA